MFRVFGRELAPFTLAIIMNVLVSLELIFSIFYVGFFNLYVRAFVNPYTIFVDGKTISKGGWSHTLTRTYYKENISHNSLTLPNITKGEFYIDIDPGFGNGNNIPIANESNNSNIVLLSM